MPDGMEWVCKNVKNFFFTRFRVGVFVSSKHSSPRSSNTTTTTGPFLEIKGIMLQIDKPTRRVFIIGD